MNDKMKNNGINLAVYGKVPPQAREMEKVVLGAIMLEKGTIEIVSEYLKPESFYVDAHIRIFSAMVEMSAKSKPIDILTVVEEMQKRGELELVGGAYYITSLTNSVVSSAHTVAHCKTINEKFEKRELIRISGNILSSSYDDKSESANLKADLEKELTKLTGGNDERLKPIVNLLVESAQRVEELKKQGKRTTGIPSEFEDLDNLTHGWQKEDLIILAARPSVGKTAFALNLARNAAHSGSTVGFFSLEMSSRQCTDRIISAESGVHLGKIMNGDIYDDDQQNYFEGLKKLSEMKIFFDDTPALTLFQLKSKARKLKRKGVDIIFVDYLQLMSGEGNRNTNRENEISNISRGIKALAKELSIPIIALSQLSRSVEDKGDKKPELRHLRESGAIEQDADMVMFLYRPEYYNIKTDAIGETTSGYTELAVLKNRNGALAAHQNALKFKAELSIQKFSKWIEHNVIDNAPLGSSWKPIQKTEALTF